MYIININKLLYVEAIYIGKIVKHILFNFYIYILKKFPVSL